MQTINRNKVIAATEALGLDPNDTLSINMTSGCVTVVSCERDESGLRRMRDGEVVKRTETFKVAEEVAR